MEKTNSIYIGVDIGGTAAKIGMVDSCGNILKSIVVPVAFDGYETPILTTVTKALKEFLSEVDKNIIEAIGVSATGAIDSKNGIVAGSGGHIKNWLGSKIKEVLEQEFRIPTFVLNDANAAALGEIWQGGAKNKKDVVVVTIGTGVGGGVIVDGHILLGNHGFAGEIGYIKPPFTPNEPLVGRGCYEDYASTTALIRMVKQAAIEGIVENQYIDDVNGKIIFDAIKAGDKAMETISEKWINNIAAGIVGLVHIFNPEVILIGGGVSAQKELFIDKLSKQILSEIMDEFTIDLEIKAAELKNDAGMIGAVKFAIDSIK